MRLLRRVGAGERNGAPVGRHRRGLPESRPRDERTDRPTRDVQRVDARYLVLPAPGGVLQPAEHDRAPAGGPSVPRTEPQPGDPRAPGPPPPRQGPCRPPAPGPRDEVRVASPPSSD